MVNRRVWGVQWCDIRRLSRCIVRRQHGADQPGSAPRRPMFAGHAHRHDEGNNVSGSLSISRTDSERLFSLRRMSSTSSAATLKISCQVVVVESDLERFAVVIGLDDAPRRCPSRTTARQSRSARGANFSATIEWCLRSARTRRRVRSHRQASSSGCGSCA